ncbi:MAG TPA: nucleotide exchange factor GrpE [Anaeromyxobacter sp.]|nr:nucleotide exchange factor GrpE [Anaeromyxobacter sp.]
MADSPNKGAFQADIPADAVLDALRSVERVKGGEASAEPPAAPGEGAEVAIEPQGQAAGEDQATERERSLEAQLELSQEKARETLERLKDTHDRYVRAVADLENYKKRAQKERDEVLRYGNEKLLKDLFPVVDGLDRALAAVPEADRGAATPAPDPLLKGVRLVRASLEQALARHGVTSFDALGQAFDPARHEALLQVPTAEEAPGTVVMQHARGFLLHERLVRPAMVGVAAPPQAEPPRAEVEGEAAPGGGAADGKTRTDGGEG